MTSNPAQSLAGLELEGGWKVVAKLSLGASTGGYFSVSYQAKNTDGRIRRECTDHIITFGQRHLKQVLDSYVMRAHRHLRTRHRIAQIY